MTCQPALHAHTPTLAVIEPRGLLARSVAFHRAQAGAALSERVDRTTYDAAARPVGRWDARLWAAANQAPDAPRNLTYVHSLSGRRLFSDSVDAGWSAVITGVAGQVACCWDGRGHSQRVEYDLSLRPVAVFESDGTVESCAERLSYAGAGNADANQCGCLIRHDDPAGSVFNALFGLTGAVVDQTRRFLNTLEAPDWPACAGARDNLLEPGVGFDSSWKYGPTQTVIEQCDAMGHIRLFNQTVAGQLRQTRLQLSGLAAQALVSDIRYNAQGQIESETAGNGIVTTARYRQSDGRLIQLDARDDQGGVRQDLSYEYDAVGNVTRIEDRVQPTHYCGGKRVEPVSTYRYDTLYQLIEATGREFVTLNRGPDLPVFQSPPDPSQLAHYKQTYDYDAGGNLQVLSHTGGQNHSLNMVTARHSNRSLAVLNDVPPSEADIAAAFDGNGNLRELQPGQTLTWDRRNQLQQVRPVIRESGPDDSESYVYDSSGRRVRKVTKTLARSVTHTAEVGYLPGVEIRSNTATGETLHVITLQGGRNSVRVLHWQQGKPEGITNDQIRYGLSDHLGSCTLELDQQAQTISHESYYPFGGTSWWAGRSEVEARYKTVRYSGKERDATGLYYYGLRYYAPWLMRWISPDPMEEISDLNRYQFVGNQPINFFDILGLVKWPWQRGTAPEVAEFIEIYKREDVGGARAFHGRELEVEAQKLMDVVGKMNEQPTLTDYVDGGSGAYREINNHLRGFEQGNDSTLNAIQDLDSEYQQLTDYSGVAYRAVKTGQGIYADKIRPGDVVRDGGYMSASALVRNSISWLETWTDNLTQNPEHVVFVMSKDVPKKVAGIAMLGDHLLVAPGEFMKVADIKKVSSTSSGQTVKVVGLRPVGHIERHDIKDIQTGEMVMAAERGLGQRLLRRIERRMTRALQA
ncbi:RHS repeat-associated core domain-containing protein [Xanthomonas sp. WHRI 1810A]|uniref:RHS repeat-associated core domain-containing protein n=1 Tax=Xanthomonas sp. WHRI 1810A TaxID=3161565 RepID=UPI0032E88EA0